ncbi:MAG: adenylate/guanylate cyclase domain-containing protein [Gallionella sp.]|nr:adenylate/guanylate cyclase domain-containing protein [Gallionella sp.]
MMKNHLKKRAIPIGLGLLLLLAFLLHTGNVVNLPLIQQLEAITYDARLRLFMPKTQYQRVVIVDIDEQSLAEEGRWPWGRDRLALLLDMLFERHHVAVVGFDMVFAEKDENSGLKVLEQLGQGALKAIPQFQSAMEKLRPQLDHDRLFAEKLKHRPVILGYYFSGNDNRISGALPLPSLPAGAFTGKRADFLSGSGYGANLPELQKNAYGAGHFNPLPDHDGVTRRVPMLMEFQGAYYESLALAIVRALLGNGKLEAVFGSPAGEADETLEWLNIAGKIHVPVDQNACAYIPYRGPQGSFRYISASDMMRGRIDSRELQGAVVLVGTTAPGLMDMRSTPVGVAYPGVEIHANLISGMLDNTIMQKPGYTLGAEVALLLLFGVVLAVALPLLSPLKGTLASLAAIAAVTGLNLTAWQSAHLILPLAATLSMIVALFVLSMSYGFFVESRAKHQISGLFGQYVPPELVAEMSANPKNFTMESESREMTVMFSDMLGFTKISETLSPKDLSKLMNDYMTPMTRIIHKHRGTIDKYIGDAIMAFWGAPMRDPDHARNAVLAGLEMQATLAVLRPRFIERGWPEVKIGIGANTGIMRVGNMGSEFRMAYTVMGDAVNLGSRLEGLTRQYGADFIISEATRKAVPEVLCRELDRVCVKGKDEPVVIYEPLGLEEQVEETVKSELRLFEEALRLYRAQNWDLAEMQLLDLQKAAPDCRLYPLYLERIAHFRAEPPGTDWDGVLVFHTK